jgi:hypothetical protein
MTDPWPRLTRSRPAAIIQSMSSTPEPQSEPPNPPSGGQTPEQRHQAIIDKARPKLAAALEEAKQKGVPLHKILPVN